MTWRGIELLRQADLVLYDYLANPDVLVHVRAGAEAICLGQHGRIAHWSQQAIEQRMIEAARAGQHVVRLKGGDPGIFGRLADELDALANSEIEFEVVPGASAALAAAAYAGIPLTDRSLASAVAFVAGQQRSDGPSLDYQALAAFPGTLVIYMGVTEVANWSGRLIEAGKTPTTPVAVIRHCSLPRQEVFCCQLADLAAEVVRRHLRPPVLFICGDVVQRRERFNWFERRSLHGLRILTTRPRHQQAELNELLRERGAEVFSWSAIEIGPPDTWQPVDRAWDKLTRHKSAAYNWLVFSSVNGVRAMMERAWSRGLDLRALQGVQLAAIGPGTADALAGYFLKADVVPATFQAEALADALLPEAAGQRFLLVRASRGREVLAEMLTAAGADVEQVVAYTSRDVETVESSIQHMLDTGQIDWVTVTSSAIARSLCRQFGDRLRGVKLVSISPITSVVLAELGLPVTAEATQATMSGVVAALERLEQVRPQRYHAPAPSQESGQDGTAP
jgi:uroporphyrinogen III methyltransferase/synthase